MRASSSIGSISGNGVGAAALKRCRSSRSRLRRSQSIRDDVHSSRLDCPRLERRLRTCTCRASYSRNPAFRGSGRCATSRLPKLQSRQGSDTEPAGQMRSCQRQSRQGRHSLLARATSYRSTLACCSVVSVKALGGFTAGGAIGLPSTRRCSRFRIWVLVGAPASSVSSTAASTACSSCWRTRARISTISRSPPGVLSMRCCRARKAGGSSTKGAPLRKAPGLHRWKRVSLGGLRQTRDGSIRITYLSTRCLAKDGFRCKRRIFS